MEKKISIPVEVLCQNLPEEFSTFISYNREMKFTDKPDYAYLRKLFKDAM